MLLNTKSNLLTLAKLLHFLLYICILSYYNRNIIKNTIQYSKGVCNSSELALLCTPSVSQNPHKWFCICSLGLLSVNMQFLNSYWNFMKKSTDELLKILKRTPDLNDYLKEEQENILSSSLHEHLMQLTMEKNISMAQCIKEAGIDRTYGYQIFSGAKTPTRDKVIALSFGLHLTFEETQTLLKSNSYAILYAKDKRDSAIIFALQRNQSLLSLNELLFQMDLDIIK